MAPQFQFQTGPGGAQVSWSSNPPTAAYNILVTNAGPGTQPPPPYNNCQGPLPPPFTIIGTYNFEVIVAPGCLPKQQAAGVDAGIPMVTPGNGGQLNFTFNGANPGEIITIELIDGGGETGVTGPIPPGGTGHSGQTQSNKGSAGSGVTPNKKTRARI